MKPYTAILILIAACLSVGSVHARDVIHLKSGSKINAEVQKLEGSTLKFALLTEAGSASSSVAYDQVERIEFNHLTAITNLTKDLSQQSEKVMRAQWEMYEHLLTLPESGSGELGIALARILLGDDDKANDASALAVAQRIVRDDWNPERKERAEELIIEIEIAMGEASDIEAKTEEWLQSDQPQKRITASYMRALVMIEQYKAFLEENPRWERDPAASKEHARLYHGIFDLLLIPSQEYRLRDERTARSVWEMAQFYEFLGDRKNAVSVARDIVEIYPETSFRGLAEQFIQNNPTES